MSKRAAVLLLFLPGLVQMTHAATPTRDPAPVAAAIDAEVDKRLKEEGIPASPQANDAEFLRRVTLDLTGRIPTAHRTVAFLESRDPDRRRKLIDDLLSSPTYGEHLATIWRNRLVPPNPGVVKKGRDNLSPWLIEQFNRNRGWNEIVSDLLTAEGEVNELPQSGFLMANAENGTPKPALLAGATAQHFWGIQLRCTECHDHPCAPLKQTDFWGTAAFFGRLRFTGNKGRAASLTEMPDAENPKVATAGGVITIPTSAGTKGGRTVKARFLGGAEPSLPETGAYRPIFARWATGADHPYFARAAVNRTWAHFFGRGIVHPVDHLETEAPSHPELMSRLTKEFTESGFDLKHLARCICNSKTYQRTTKPVTGNENDRTLLSHMSLKVMSPEMFFDSVSMLVHLSGGASRSPVVKGTKTAVVNPELSRDDFARVFRSQGDSGDLTEYTQGIPQMLRLLNGPLLNNGGPLAGRLAEGDVGREVGITTLFLAALSRVPSPDEMKAMSGYLERRQDARAGYRGVLWILLNSSEFAINH